MSGGRKELRQPIEFLELCARAASRPALRGADFCMVTKTKICRDSLGTGRSRRARERYRAIQHQGQASLGRIRLLNTVSMSSISSYDRDVISSRLLEESGVFSQAIRRTKGALPEGTPSGLLLGTKLYSPYSTWASVP